MSEDIIFDKAEWHFDGDFPKGLDKYQGYVHTGLYLGWIMDNDMVNEAFKNKYKTELALFLDRKLSPVKFYHDSFNGVFSAEYLSNEGLEFTKEYFDLDTGEYLDDYDDLFCDDLPSSYHVKDNWDNFEAISKVISEKYSGFKKKTGN
ncbi:MAG: hypothetical protein JWQ38_1674 [Flavipsychrobacter sp.]|nr:hypothetical protein [Flavipsychrobacter sp.]